MPLLFWLVGTPKKNKNGELDRNLRMNVDEMILT
jgi:hypothetical protein